MRVASGRVILSEGEETFEVDEETERMFLESIAQCKRGQTVSLAQVLDELRGRE